MSKVIDIRQYVDNYFYRRIDGEDYEKTNTNNCHVYGYECLD